MLSIFDLELLSLDELSLIYPYTGENENLYRCYIALLLEAKGLLEPSLLSVEETRDTFIKFLSSTEEELQQSFDHDVNPNLDRILYVYTITIDKFIQDEMTFAIPFEFQYDEAYMKYIHNLTIDKIINLVLDLPGYQIALTMVLKEYATRVYPKIVEEYVEDEGIYDTYKISDRSYTIYLGYLSEIAFNDENKELYKEILYLAGSHIFSILIPTVESIGELNMFITQKMMMYIRVIVGTIKAILGKSLLVHVPEENLGLVLQYMNDIGYINCVRLYAAASEKLTNDEKSLFIRNCPQLNEFVQRSVLVTQPEREFWGI